MRVEGQLVYAAEEAYTEVKVDRFFFAIAARRKYHRQGETCVRASVCVREEKKEKKKNRETELRGVGLSHYFGTVIRARA